MIKYKDYLESYREERCNVCGNYNGYNPNDGTYGCINPKCRKFVIGHWAAIIDQIVRKKIYE